MTNTVVTDWLWSEGELIDEGFLFATDDCAAAVAGLRGHFGLHQEQSGVHRLARDWLGVNKRFYALPPEGEDGPVTSSAFLHELLAAGHPIDRISSVPWGHVVEIEPAKQRIAVHKALPLPFGPDDDDLDDAALASSAKTVRAALEKTFGWLASALAGREVYVTLSGGLDSTSIAALAAAQFTGGGRAKKPTAVSFSVVDPRDPDDVSEDLRFARRAAEALGLELLEVTATPDDILGLVDTVLDFGQDWRDFNVHCALVNAVLARAIGARHPPDDGGARPVVLTGDTMNELLADYSPVRFEGHEYYALPDMSRGKVRRFLAQGLDAGDREVGVFARFGVDCVQPYALCADAYTALPGGLCNRDQAKQQLVVHVMGDAVPDFIYARPKVRAQAGGSKVGGTLGVLAKAGIDQPALARRYCERLGLTEKHLRTLIRVGMYRFFPRWPRARGPRT